jgi:hypothetical protein
LTATSDPLPPLAEEFLEHLQGIMHQHSAGEISTLEAVEQLELTLEDINVRKRLAPAVTALELLNENLIYARFTMVIKMLISHLLEGKE